MNVNKYQILVKIVDSGSIKKASESLGYTSSAISQALRSIEDEFGIKMLVRNKNGITLTTEGEQLMPYIRSICNTESYLQQKIDSLKGMYSGTITIGAYHSVAATILPNMIKEFSVLYPNIRFNIYEGDLFMIDDWIKRGDIDFGFLALEELEHHQCINLIDDPMVAVVPPDDEDAKRAFYPIELFKERPLVSLNEHRDRELFRIFRQNNISTVAKYEVEEYETVIGMVANGLGVGYIPFMAISENAAVVCIPTDPPYSRQLGLALRDLGRASRAVRAFVDYAQKRYA